MAHPLLDKSGITLNEVMKAWPQTVRIFLKHGMLCVGCPINPFHMITDACNEYHLDEEAFRRELMDAVAARS